MYRSYEIITVDYFCVHHKNRRKPNQHSKLLYLKMNLHFDISDQISAYRKLNLLPITSIYLVFFSLEMQKKLVQTKFYYKPIRVAAAKKSFLMYMYIIDTTCFDERFLFYVITRRHYFLYKFIVTQRFGETTMLLRSLKLVA